jgi:hypothetical protein
MFCAAAQQPLQALQTGLGMMPQQGWQLWGHCMAVLLTT